MQSITAKLTKVRDGRRRAETERDMSQNLLTKSIIKTETCSQSTSSNPYISVVKSCNPSSHSQTKQYKDPLHLPVCLIPERLPILLLHF